MYVADVTDMRELEELLAETEDRLLADPLNEQAQWDREDIIDRMYEIGYPAPTPKLDALMRRTPPWEGW